MKKTFNELKEINNIFARLSKNKEFPKTKLFYAFKRFIEKNVNNLFTDYNDLLQYVRLDNALTDKSTGAILYEAGNELYKYSPEGLKNVSKEIKRISKEWDEKEFEVEPYICNDIPESIEFYEGEKELLDGVIININK